MNKNDVPKIDNDTPIAPCKTAFNILENYSTQALKLLKTLDKSSTLKLLAEALTFQLKIIANSELNDVNNLFFILRKIKFYF